MGICCHCDQFIESDYFICTVCSPKHKEKADEKDKGVVKKHETYYGLHKCCCLSDFHGQHAIFDKMSFR